MFLIILQILTIILPSPTIQEERGVVWEEHFSIPGKGVWGSGKDSILADFSGISTWTLDYSGAILKTPDDYAKTVATSGGRFECRDLEGTVVWRSESIDISAYEEVNIRLTAYETGSGANTEAKFLKAFFRLDDRPQEPFSIHGTNAGNWGAEVAEQKGLSGETLQIICIMANHYSGDKVTLDEVVVWRDAPPLPDVKPHDVVINELMPDPYPPRGLPEEEFIELFNTRPHPLNTEGWKLIIDGVEKALPAQGIEAEDFLLLCSTSAAGELAPYGNTAGVPGFQGLLNKGALIEIRDETGRMIDRIQYNDQWYGDEAKNKGGWSLERIDPYRHCHQKKNWSAGTHADGGTPGIRNSIRATNPDTLPPVVRWAVAVTPHEIELAFSEPVDTLVMKNPEHYIFNEQVNPSGTEVVTPEKMTLRFIRPFAKDETSLLQVKNLTDECGNPAKTAQFHIQWNTLEPGDIIINELLFDPVPDGEDYVEIFNNSGKIIPLSRLFLANRDENREIGQQYPLTREKTNFFPDTYRALTEDTAAVFPWFFIQCPACFLQMEQIPAFPNEKGTVVLLNEAMQVVDEFSYNEEIHTPFLADTEGISLERISADVPASNPENWHSASTEAGYGTPGYKNSQAEPAEADSPRVTFDPEAFSPNNDGYNDEYIIRYSLKQTGFAGNVKIFDVEGRPVMDLTKNAILGLSGEIIWDGRDETGRRQPWGVYVVLVEIFNDEGRLYRFKDGVVLTGLRE